MTYLSEDPTYLAGALVVLAGLFVIALKTTQQGKYLLCAVASLVLALGVVVVEWMWVTDRERIEKVVYDVRTAVLNGDADEVLAHLASNVMYQRGETTIAADATRALIRANVSNIHLEFARISELRISVGQQTRKGVAEFRVFTKGNWKTTSSPSEGLTTMTSWSLGFQETEPGVWKITRISAGSIPTGILAVRGGIMPSGESRIGRDEVVVIPQSEANPFPRNRGGRPTGRSRHTRTQTN